MLAIVRSAFFNGQGNSEVTDTNGNRAVHLTPVAGEFPRRLRVIAGTVAINASIETGRTYLVNSEFVRMNTVGEGKKAQQFPQYNIEVIQEVTSVIDLLKAKNELGDVKNIGDTPSQTPDPSQTPNPEEGFIDDEKNAEK